MRDRVRNFVVRITRLVASRLGFDMVWRDYYSPIPDLARIPESLWNERSELVGIDLPSVDRQLDYMAAKLAPFLDEFRAPPGFALQNGSYGAVDAEVLYAMVRAAKPRRVIEIGAGYSTLVTAAACRLNASEGHPVRFVAMDPFPATFLTDGVAGLSELTTARIEDASTETFTALEAGDILFLDTTHTVKLGGDVTRLVLEVLPRLAPGVTVHLHDIFLPWQYPRRWFEQNAYYWAEQYLVQAFLSFNTEFELLLACHMLARERPAELRRLVPSLGSTDAPAALWLRRRDQPRPRMPTTP